MKIYCASSWRNEQQQTVVAALRAAGHEVYDFKHPTPSDTGFSWSQIDPNWKSWTLQQSIEALASPIAEAGFGSDWNAMKRSDTCVLVLPCGRSAHLEAGYFVGAGKRLYILILADQEPELMYKMAEINGSIHTTIEGLVEQLASDIKPITWKDWVLPIMGIVLGTLLALVWTFGGWPWK